MPLDLEHPQITEMNRKGYLNLMDQPEHCGFDYFGCEIISGDDVVMDGNETILKDNLERYLSEVYGFTFQTIE